MADYESHQHVPFAPRSRFFSFLARDWPYVLMLALALAGVARTSVGVTGMESYWMVVAPVYALICVAVHWRDIKGPEPHWRLIRTQAFHWIAVMLAMSLVFIGSVRQMMNSDATALTALAMLALGTFTAGVHAEAWRICVVGIVLGLAVPAIAWLETSTVIILMVLVALVALAVIVFLHTPIGTRKGAGPASP
jgi:hypothetical protein